MEKFLKKNEIVELKIRHLYSCKARNIKQGVYIGEGKFIGLREKFRHIFLDTELLNVPANAPYNTVDPIQDLGEIPIELELYIYRESIDSEFLIENSKLVEFLIAKANEQKAGQCLHANCKHPLFDLAATAGMTVDQIRHKYPRSQTVCPDCGNVVILYASAEHYFAGDW